MSGSAYKSTLPAFGTAAGTVCEGNDSRVVTAKRIPQGFAGTTRTLVAGDAGGHVYVSGNVTVNTSTFVKGDAVTIVNSSGSAITIISGSGVTIRLAGTSTTASPRTLAAYGMATILCVVDSTTFFASGAGLA